ERRAHPASHLPVGPPQDEERHRHQEHGCEDGEDGDHPAGLPGDRLPLRPPAQDDRTPEQRHCAVDDRPPGGHPGRAGAPLTPPSSRGAAAAVHRAANQSGRRSSWPAPVATRTTTATATRTMTTTSPPARTALVARSVQLVPRSRRTRATAASSTVTFGLAIGS